MCWKTETTEPASSSFIVVSFQSSESSEPFEDGGASINVTAKIDGIEFRYNHINGNCYSGTMIPDGVINVWTPLN